MKYLTYGMVAFIDLLGFSEKVKAIKTDADLHAVERDVRRVQQWFEHKPSEDYIKQSQKITGKKVLAISDSIVVLVPSDSEMASQEGDFDVMLSELSGYAYAQGSSVQHGIFLRGAVDYDMWYRKKDVLISPAMVKAVEREKQTCVPIISVTEEFYSQLSQHPLRRVYHQSDDPIKRLFKRFSDLPNGETIWAIDYIPLCLEAVMPQLTLAESAQMKTMVADVKQKFLDDAYTSACTEWAASHARCIESGFNSSPLAKVKTKYEWLANYHNNCVKAFFGKPDQRVFVSELV